MMSAEGTTDAGERLLVAASDLFYRHGINSVGVAAVAAAAGVTKKTLYDCFGSKAFLVARYLQRRHDAWWSHLESQLAAGYSPRALTVFEAYFDHPWFDVTRGCAFLNGAAELAADHPGMAVIREHKSAVRGLLIRLIAEDFPGVGEPEAVAEHLFLLAEGALAHRLVDGGPGQLRQANRIAAKVLDAAG